MSDHTVSDRPAAYDSTTGAAPVSPAPGKSASRWEDFVDIFYAPSDVFARRESSGFGIPMLIVTIASAVIMFASFNAMSPIMDAEFAKGAAAAAKQGVSAEQMASMRSVGEKIAKVMAVVGPPVMIFLMGLLLWVAGKLVGARQTLNAALVVASYAFVPRVVGGLVSGAQALLMDPGNLTSRYSIAVSAARFLDPVTTNPFVLALAGRVDLFTIWVTVLLAIGLAVTGRIPRSQAAIAAFFVWVLGSIPDILAAARQ